MWLFQGTGYGRTEVVWGQSLELPGHNHFLQEEELTAGAGCGELSLESPVALRIVLCVVWFLVTEDDFPLCPPCAASEAGVLH